ncbi:MAG TPA: hypothetical protein VEL79_00055 [Vicinamibacterales bacterium]|nr:hypothetical protein [Vicinamibacterales bacterium]
MRILRGLTSRLLPCGCIVGVYETYEGEVVTLLDDREPACKNPEHANGNQIPALAGLEQRDSARRSSQK